MSRPSVETSSPASRSHPALALLRETLGEPGDDLVDEIVCLLDRVARLVDEHHLDAVPARAEIIECVAREQFHVAAVRALRLRRGVRDIAAFGRDALVGGRSRGRRCGGRRRSPGWRGRS
ncbi:hypothetical protein [Vulcanimicrobium alpinum]|uniref:hypothetical protein n=1 Tax=Vulcanimicrobium alpinum TaxID=3016050 RepID=UPI00295F54FA|nr:hypothetical protein [Vulcanimicrobium alpinum]